MSNFSSLNRIYLLLTGTLLLCAFYTECCPSSRCVCRGTQSMKCLPSGSSSSVPVFRDIGQIFETVSLVRNNLTSIRSRAFINLQVRYLDMSGNKFSGGLGHSSFRGLEHVLDTLLLSNCELATIPSSSLQRLTSLRTLRLDGNFITAVPQNAFQSLAQLVDLSLYRNVIQSVEQEAFNGLINLQQLKLFHNSLTTLGSGGDAWVGLGNLTSLDLSHNLLTDVHFTMTLSQLTWLDLEDNQLNSLTRSTFRGLRKVKYLNINENPLTTIRNNPFRRVRRLRYLSLNVSSVTTLESHMFRGLDHLKTLYIGDVNRSTLPNGVFKSLPVLQRLSMTDHHSLLSGLTAEMFEPGVLSNLNIWTVPFRQCNCNEPWIQRLMSRGVYIHGYCQSGQPVGCQRLLLT